MEDHMAMYRTLDEDGQIPKQIEQLRAQVEKTRKGKLKLLDYNASGEISDSVFLAMNR